MVKVSAGFDIGGLYTVIVKIEDEWVTEKTVAAVSKH